MTTKWPLSKLGNVVTLVMGQAPAGTDCNRDGIGTPFVKVGEFGNERPVIREWTTDPKKMARYTDVLICVVGATCGKINLGQDCAIGRSVAAIRPKPDLLEQRYLWYFMQGKVLEMRQGSQGAAQTVINREMINSLVIPLPPVEQQRRIVAMLDDASNGIATATANAQKNLTNARALFDGYLESTFNKKGDGWKDVTLGKACKVERGSSPRPIKSFVTTEDDGQNWIKIGDTKNDSKYVTQTKQRITPVGALKSRKVDPGDFILTNSMSFGKPYIMKISGFIHDGWFALRLGDGIDTEYFYYLLSSPIVQTQFQNLAAGAIVLNISGDLVKKAILPIPPIEQQREIVNRILLVDDETSKLAGIYETKLAALTELKQSLLHKAFAGELT